MVPLSIMTAWLVPVVGMREKCYYALLGGWLETHELNWPGCMFLNSSLSSCAA